MFWYTMMNLLSFSPIYLNLSALPYDSKTTERGCWCSQTLRKGNGRMIACRGFDNFLNHT
ncbi:hypothetical protein GIB67_002073 [Kingdonia uniflora]|uniref:Uncharacterized protein n=1 Tax=Kingdonia uniflora TaxID=39325 RepID=A0A7J7KWI0_9MAGN|nr:hypothetical protein GIB67_002073 [Kingdonia uniflora]